MTHKQLVLQLLKDGKPHSHHELYGLGCVAHSRISDLRRDGHTIEQWRDGDLYLYRLLNEAAPTKGGRPSLPERSFVEHATASNPPFSSLGDPASTAHHDRDGAGVLTLFGDAA